MGACAAGASAGEVRSLRIEDRVAAAGTRPGSGGEIVYHLVNDSKKTITAWDFGCVDANQAGHGSQSSVGSDSYFWLELKRRQRIDAPKPEALLFPGERIEQHIALEPNAFDGPHAGRSCGPTLVIFDDATYEGPAFLADSRFEARALQAISAYRTRAELERELERGAPVMKAVATVAARRTRSASSPGGGDFGAAQLENYLMLEKTRGFADLQQIVGELDAYYQGALAHLPASWQRKVRSEVAR